MRDMREFARFLRQFLFWLLLGGCAGILVGIAVAFFLVTLEQATLFRNQHPLIILGLPLCGYVLAWVYDRYGRLAKGGNALIINETHHNDGRVPTRMMPFILFGTIFTHLFGGSAGREGTGVQMGASIVDTLARLLQLDRDVRRLLLMAGISAGFGAVFGTPIAGFVFGMEVQSMGRIRYDGLIPCLVGAFFGDWTVRMLGVTHTHYPLLPHLELEPLLMAKVVVASVLFGLTSLLFIECSEWMKHRLTTAFPYAPYRAVVGGLVVIGLTVLVGNMDYNGLSTPLIKASLSGETVVPYAFLLKIVFTAVTLGSGFVGGEVTPLFMMGATLGATLAGLLGVDPIFLASMGFVAVFAGASNTPLACALMGIELFGGGSAQYVVVACAIAYLASGHRSIYNTQRIHIAKSVGTDVVMDESIRERQTRMG